MDREAEAGVTGAPRRTAHNVGSFLAAHTGDQRGTTWTLLYFLRAPMT